MPGQGPGVRVPSVATKAVNHGDPVVENKVPGLAAKTKQLQWFVQATDTAAKQIAIAEPFIIMVGGVVEVAYAKWSVGGPPTVGMQVWIVEADNTLANATAAGRVKYGVVQELDAVRSVAKVNLNLAGNL